MTASVLHEVASELRTERLLLRCPMPGDGEAVYQAVLESIAELRAWPASLPWAVFEPSAAASETFCRESLANFIKRSALVYLVFERESGRFVACTSLHGINWQVPKFEVGFWCRTSLHRKGYASEAVRALVAYAQDLGARRIECITDEQNHACRALCQSVGMTLEGILRNERITPDGQLRNTCIYALVR